MLLTRSPLSLHRYCYRMESVRLACVRHAASVRPEPGSNSPSRFLDTTPEGGTREPESQPEGLFFRLTTSAASPRGAPRRSPLRYFIDVRPTSAEAPMSRPHWLLALALPFSRSDRALTTRVSVPGPRGRASRRPGFQKIPSDPPHCGSDFEPCGGKVMVTGVQGAVNAGPGDRPPHPAAAARGPGAASARRGRHRSPTSARVPRRPC